MKKLVLTVSALLSILAVNAQNISLEFVSTYTTGIFDDGGSEIIAYDPASQRIFSTNGGNNTLDIIDISNPAAPVLFKSVDLSAYGGNCNSVATNGGRVVVAMENDDKQANGKVVFFDKDGVFKKEVTAGALPDMVTFTPDGNKVLTANEGEPNDDYTNDPVGSITIIDISAGIQNAVAVTVDFSSFNGTTLDNSVRIFGNDGKQTIAQDLEPEYIAVSADSKTIFVSLQENNALAIIDISGSTPSVSIKGLGFKDHSKAGNGIDASDKDGIINIKTFPVWGMYQPDAIATFEYNGNTYIITANEGDGRDYAGYSEEARIKDLVLDPVAFPNAATLQTNEEMGRLTVTTANGDMGNDGDYEELYCFGGRSFSIWSKTGTLIFDSGDEIERKVSEKYPNDFNSTNDENGTKDNRSDNKGPEPEAVTIGVIDGKTYAFIGLERIGGVMIYDISNPTAPVYIDYINNRDFTKDATTAAAGDLGVEDIVFISGADSPDGDYYIATANEVSGTVTLFRITGIKKTAVKDVDYITTTWKVYPNPTNSATIKFSETHNYTIYTTTGIAVISEENTNTLNIADLATGIYIIKDEFNRSQKLIVK